MEIKHDVEAMRETATQIESIRQTIEENVTDWHNIVNSLGEVWQDAAYDALAELNGNFAKEQNQFIEKVEAFKNYINASANDIETTVANSAGRLTNTLG